MKAPTFLSLISLIAGLLVGSDLHAADTNLDLARQLNQAFIEVAERVSPAVVVINVTEKPTQWTPPDTNDSEKSAPPGTMPREFWRQFHQQFEDDLPEQGQGSGVIIRKDGFILTNRHVVDNAEKIQVRLRDGRTYTATVRGVDPQSDVAVIKIEADNLPVARLADSSKTRVGEFAIAIGAPFSYDYSVTFGHVSAKGRSNVVPAFEGGAAMDQDFIQTDANINPGNSGGPLLNIDGEVIGINTLIRGLHTGIGFAIPSNLAREVSDKLIAEGKFTRPWLGIKIGAVKDDPDFRELVKGTDLRPSDVITAVDGKSVGTPQELRNEVRVKAIGQTVTLDVFRAGKNLKIKIKPEENVDPVMVASNSRSSRSDAAPAGLGLTIHALTPDLASQFGVDATEGVIVVGVERGSPAARKGIKPGDIITALGSQTVGSPKQFADALKKADLKKGVIVHLVTGNVASFEILKEGAE
jgi:serine protease Do